MAVKTPWMTSDDIISAVKRKISFPTAQQTFTDSEILDFANEEMFIAQVPSVLLYHQEFFVTYKETPLAINKIHYAIPNRAIGLKLRDVFYVDNNSNLFQMTRINPEEQAWFQRDYAGGIQPYPYFIENNDIVLTSNNIPNPTGSIRMSFFLRPNQLVTDDNAAIITSFCKQITINNATIAVDDNITVTTNASNGSPTNTIYTVISGSPLDREFLIGANSAATAVNFANAINLDGTYTASVNGNIVTIFLIKVTDTVVASNTTGFDVNTDISINFDQMPSSITNNSEIDFLQTKPGHKILNYDVAIGSNGISGTQISFDPSDVPDTLVVGDYICASNTAIIPYLPPDLHTVLAERTAARILSAIGDLENLQAVNTKIAEMEKNQGSLIDNRIEGQPIKVSNKHSMLRSAKRNLIRRF